MLANTYTTRADLTEEETIYLVRIREMLLLGKIKPEQFTMDNFGGYTGDSEAETRQISCDTIGCIGGWMTALARVDHVGPLTKWDHHKQELVFGSRLANTDHYTDKKFKCLFYPSDWMMHMATPADGARAITNFLNNKKRPWGFMRKDGSHAV